MVEANASCDGWAGVTRISVTRISGQCTLIGVNSFWTAAP
jgi:hypothetical protein